MKSKIIKDIETILGNKLIPTVNHINYNYNLLDNKIISNEELDINFNENKELIEENKQLLSILILAISGLFNTAETQNIVNNMNKNEIVSTIKTINNEYNKKRKILNILNSELLEKLKIIESGKNPNKIGDNNKAYGILQIHKEVIDDVNRIYNTNFEHKDAFDERKSEIICKLYLMHYGSLLPENIINEETLARIWNGGPKGYTKKATDKYVNKLRKLKIS